MRIFSFILPVRISGLLFSEFLLVLGCYFMAVLGSMGAGSWMWLFAELGWARVLIAAISVLLGIFVNNMYAQTRSDSRVALVLKLCNVIGIALIVQGVLAYVSSDLGLPRFTMLSGSLLAFLVLLMWRLFYGTVVLKIIGTQSTLFIGRDAVSEEIGERITAHPELGIGLAGYLDDNYGGGGETSESHLGQYLGPVSALDAIAGRMKFQRVVIGMLDRRQQLPIATLLRLARSGVLIEEAATAYESVCGRVCSRELRPSQIIFHNELATRPGSLALQSIYANLLALSGILVTSPLLILCAAAVKLSSRGPVFEQDVRVGQHGIPFTLNRFRCHRATADTATGALDGRITGVGHWLRRLHLVNLPRLFNLLRGEISLVGPRPERPEFVEELSRYFAFYQQRHSVKPGMTGWSQINTTSPGRQTDALIQLEYDLYYTKHISLALDAYILMHGIRAILPFASQ